MVAKTSLPHPRRPDDRFSSGSLADLRACFEWRIEHTVTYGMGRPETLRRFRGSFRGIHVPTWREAHVISHFFSINSQNNTLALVGKPVPNLDLGILCCIAHTWLINHQRGQFHN